MSKRGGRVSAGDTGVARLRAGTFMAMLCVAGCSSMPDSVRVYAAELPARADGQYALLEEPIKKQLVLKDALLQCSLDLNDGKAEEESAACKCSKSASENWTADCQGWLGTHTPAPEPAAPPSGPPPTSPPPAEPTPAPEP